MLLHCLARRIVQPSRCGRCLPASSCMGRPAFGPPSTTCWSTCTPSQWAPRRAPSRWRSGLPSSIRRVAFHVLDKFVYGRGIASIGSRPSSSLQHIIRTAMAELLVYSVMWNNGCMSIIYVLLETKLRAHSGPRCAVFAESIYLSHVVRRRHAHQRQSSITLPTC